MELTFRKVTFNEEVIAILNTYVQTRGLLLLWQSQARHDARQTLVTDFHPGQRIIEVSLEEGKTSIDLNQILYCKGEEKKIVFKTLEFSEENNSFKIKLPEEIHLEELRSSQRYEMLSNKNAFLSVAIFSPHDGKDSHFILKLNDISPRGCSVLVHSRSLDHFKEGQFIKITQVGSDFMIVPLMAEVKHVQQVKSKNPQSNKFYKVGLSFESKLIFPYYYLTRHLEWDYELNQD